MRFVENADGSARLELADAAYQNSDGVVVHLIGAVHVAEPQFYQGLNESFRHYDSLLYEMVKLRACRCRPAGLSPRPAGAGSACCNSLHERPAEALLSARRHRLSREQLRTCGSRLGRHQLLELQDRGESFVTLMVLRCCARHGQDRIRKAAAGRRDGWIRDAGRDDARWIRRELKRPRLAGSLPTPTMSWPRSKDQRLGHPRGAEQGGFQGPRRAGRSGEHPRHLLRCGASSIDGADADRPKATRKLIPCGEPRGHRTGARNATRPTTQR